MDFFFTKLHCWRVVELSEIDQNSAIIAWLDCTCISNTSGRDLYNPSLWYCACTVGAREFTHIVWGPDQMYTQIIMMTIVQMGVSQQSLCMSCKVIHQINTDSELLFSLLSCAVACIYSRDILLPLPCIRCTSTYLSLIHIWRCRRSTLCRSRWSPYH